MGTAGSSPDTSPDTIFRASASHGRPPATPRFKERADYIVSELKLIQDAQGDGYLGALMDRDRDRREDCSFSSSAKGIIRSGGFDLNGMWSPWYVQHKIFAGLRDAYRYTGNRTALDVEIKFATWAEAILAPLSDEQIQRMLATEFGGMNEVLADLYADTGDTRWLALAGKFHHVAIIDRLAEMKDILPGIHGNTQVPKLYGALKAVHVHRRRNRRRGGEVFLGRGDATPYLRHRRQHQERVLWTAGPTIGHGGRAHRRDLQRLQHDQNGAYAVFHAAGYSLCRLSGTRAVQSHPGVSGSR